MQTYYLTVIRVGSLTRIWTFQDFIPSWRLWRRIHFLNFPTSYKSPIFFVPVLLQSLYLSLSLHSIVNLLSPQLGNPPIFKAHYHNLGNGCAQLSRIISLFKVPTLILSAKPLSPWKITHYEFQRLRYGHLWGVTTLLSFNIVNNNNKSSGI